MILIDKTLGIEFKTSDLSGVRCKDVNGNDFEYFSYSIYDAEGDEITAVENQGNAVKTVIDFEPPFDYYLKNAKVYQYATLESDLRVWLVFAPDIPAEYGGSYEVGSNINLKYIISGSNIDFVTDKETRLNYDSENHSSKIRGVFTHAAGLQHELHITLGFNIPV